MTDQWEKDSEKFKEELPARFLSLVCVIIGTIHFGMSGWKADWILFAFVVLCFAPWLGYVFESIGGENWGAKYRKIKQGEASVPTPLAPAPAPQAQHAAELAALPHPEPAVIRILQQPSSNPNEFLYQEMKVLATLWNFQKNHPPGSRWTFTVMQGSSEYMAFSLGFLQLVRKGLADQAPNNAQVMLTDQGIAYCLAHNQEISSWRDIYDKFSN